MSPASAGTVLCGEFFFYPENGNAPDEPWFGADGLIPEGPLPSSLYGAGRFLQANQTAPWAYWAYLGFYRGPNLFVEDIVLRCFGWSQVRERFVFYPSLWCSNLKFDLPFLADTWHLPVKILLIQGIFYQVPYLPIRWQGGQFSTPQRGQFTRPPDTAKRRHFKLPTFLPFEGCACASTLALRRVDHCSVDRNDPFLKFCRLVLNCADSICMIQKRSRHRRSLPVRAFVQAPFICLLLLFSTPPVKFSQKLTRSWYLRPIIIYGLNAFPRYRYSFVGWT